MTTATDHCGLVMDNTMSRNPLVDNGINIQQETSTKEQSLEPVTANEMPTSNIKEMPSECGCSDMKDINQQNYSSDGESDGEEDQKNSSSQITTCEPILKYDSDDSDSTEEKEISKYVATKRIAWSPDPQQPSTSNDTSKFSTQREKDEYPRKQPTVTDRINTAKVSSRQVKSAHVQNTNRRGRSESVVDLERRSSILTNMKIAIEEQRHQERVRRINYLSKAVKKGTARPSQHMELMRNLATEYENSGDGDQAKTYRYLYYITKSSMLKLQEETKTKRKMDIPDAAHRSAIKKNNLPQTNSDVSRSTGALSITVWSCFAKAEQLEIRRVIRAKSTCWLYVESLPTDLYVNYVPPDISVT